LHHSLRHLTPWRKHGHPSQQGSFGRLPRIINFLPALVLLMTSGTAWAENWPAWRGPEGTGVSADVGFPLKWSDKENARWRVALPDRGNSTPIVWGDRVFITQALENEHRRTVMCFARDSGRLLWQSGVTYNQREPTNAQNPYCSASAVTDGKHVIAYFSSAGLFCYDFDGQELWRRDLGKVDSWQGSGSSPVIYQDLCILNAGPGTHAALVACNVENGEVVWKVTPPKNGGAVAAGPSASPKPAVDPPALSPTKGAGDTLATPKTKPADETPGTVVSKSGFDNAMMSADPSGTGGFLGSWSTPLIVRIGDRDELIVVHAFRVVGYDPKSGKELWWCGGLPEQAFASPAICDGRLVATGHILTGGGTRITAVKLGGASGDVTATHRLWQTDLRKECVGSPVIAGGNVYLISQFGSAVCLDLNTGKKRWENRLTGQGSMSGSWSSLVLADGKLLAPNQAGEVFILKASPDFELLATNLAAEEPTCASLALADGQIFLRTYKSLWCFGKTGG
jgi:outer membrane protein assembly factor BamB